MLRKINPFIPLILIVVISFFSILQITSFTNNEPLQTTKEEIINGKILSIIAEEETTFDNREYLSQTLQVELTNGTVKNHIATIETSLTPKYQDAKYQKGDKVLVGYMNGGENNKAFYIISYARTTPLIVLVALFIVLSFIVARRKSLYALAGMGVSLLILIAFVLPSLINGSNPLLTSIIGLTVMTPALYFISNGVNLKSTIAVASTIITLSITAFFAIIFVNAMNLSGITFEEVETLLYIHDGNFDMQGILLAGILLGALGVVDDVTITQSSVTEQLYNTNKKLSRKELIGTSMSVGRDHISSIINTLILVYVGSSLATLLLFTEFPRPLLVLINSEIVLIPIVVALIGSIGLILSIPITTVLSAVIFTRNSHKAK